MAVLIKPDNVTRLPPYRLPAGRPNVFGLTSPSGPWESRPWDGRPPRASQADRYPVCWGGPNVNFLLDVTSPGPAELFQPRRGWGKAGSVLRAPRAVLCDMALVDQLVAALGRAKLDDAGIAMANVPGAGGYDFDGTSWNSLRYGLPAQSADTYAPPFTDVDFPASVDVGHAEADQFVGGEVLFVTRLQAFYAFQSIETGRPYRFDSVGVAHDVAELNRCRPRFKRVRWVHFFTRTPPPLDDTLDQKFLAAIAAAASADVRGSLVDWTAGTADAAAAVAAEIKSFFGL